jgi:hypothetical protein
VDFFPHPYRLYYCKFDVCLGSDQYMVRIWQRFHPGETLSTIKFTFKVKEYASNDENNPRVFA